MYKSKYNFGSFYIVLSVALLLFFGGMHLIIWPPLVSTHHHEAKPFPRIFGIYFILITFYFFYIITKNIRVSLSGDFITLNYFFKRKIISAASIISVELTARRQYGLFSSRSGYFYNGIEIITETEKYFLPDQFIGSRSLLKQKIEAFSIAENIAVITPQKREPITTEEDNTKVFSGNYWLSFNGIMSIILIAVFLLIIIFLKGPHKIAGSIAFFGFFSFMFIGFSNQANYFIFYTNKLIVRNQVFIWKNKKYYFDNIQKIGLESTGKSSIVRIFFPDYTTKRFFVNNFKKSYWVALKKKIEESGMPVIVDPYLT